MPNINSEWIDTKVSEIKLFIAWEKGINDMEEDQTQQLSSFINLLLFSNSISNT